MEKDTPEDKWVDWFANWTRMNCLTNNIYWDLYALLRFDWITPVQRQRDVISRIQPNPTKFEARNGEIHITQGEFPEKHCQQMSSFSKSHVQHNGMIHQVHALSSG
ncbi:hypothetical protein PMAYCL1PPCAC_22265 [Pristionchus mayeri]|uniref:Uncharacterized protein n=1 Tax=Pristionchus mayeri TaxID=1317129 RepID=A0AAN5CX53_9BILA|nr:hypothetical protein PMAYCL1PPCAC_22265 [Pristionchus mayeri]